MLNKNADLILRVAWNNSAPIPLETANLIQNILVVRNSARDIYNDLLHFYHTKTNLLAFIMNQFDLDKSEKKMIQKYHYLHCSYVWP